MINRFDRKIDLFKLQSATRKKRAHTVFKVIVNASPVEVLKSAGTRNRNLNKYCIIKNLQLHIAKSSVLSRYFDYYLPKVGWDKSDSLFPVIPPSLK